MSLSSWKQVEAEAARIAATELRTLANRADMAPFVWTAPHLEVDVAKQPIDVGAMAAMQALAAERKLADKIASLFAAGVVNASESRPALHWALRGGGKGIPAIEAMNREA